MINDEDIPFSASDKISAMQGLYDGKTDNSLN